MLVFIFLDNNELGKFLFYCNGRTSVKDTINEGKRENKDFTLWLCIFKIYFYLFSINPRFAQRSSLRKLKYHCRFLCIHDMNMPTIKNQRFAPCFWHQRSRCRWLLVHSFWALKQAKRCEHDSQNALHYMQNHEEMPAPEKGLLKIGIENTKQVQILSSYYINLHNICIFPSNHGISFYLPCKVSLPPLLSDTLT